MRMRQFAWTRRFDVSSPESVGDDVSDAGRDASLVAGSTSVLKAALIKLGANGEVAGPRRELSEELESVSRPAVIASLLKQGRDRLELTPNFCMRLRPSCLDQYRCEPDLGPRVQELIAGSCRSGNRLLEQRLGLG